LIFSKYLVFFESFFIFLQTHFEVAEW